MYAPARRAAAARAPARATSSGAAARRPAGCPGAACAARSVRAGARPGRSRACSRRATEAETASGCILGSGCEHRPTVESARRAQPPRQRQRPGSRRAVGQDHVAVALEQGALVGQRLQKAEVVAGRSLAAPRAVARARAGPGAGGPRGRPARRCTRTWNGVVWAFRNWARPASSSSWVASSALASAASAPTTSSMATACVGERVPKQATPPSSATRSRRSCTARRS